MCEQFINNDQVKYGGPVRCNNRFIGIFDDHVEIDTDGGARINERKRLQTGDGWFSADSRPDELCTLISRAHTCVCPCMTNHLWCFRLLAMILCI